MRGRLARSIRTSTERGSTTVFTLGLLIIVLLLVVVITAAAGVHLERKKLWNLTDALALEISDAVSFQAHLGTEVSAESVQQELGKSLARSASQTAFDRLTAGENTGFTDPDRITIHLVAVHQPGPLPWVLAPWSDGITIEAEASSRITLPD